MDISRKGIFSGDRFKLYFFCLFLVSILQYSFSFGNDFVWDAESVILNDPTIRDLKYLPSYFKEDTMRYTLEDYDILHTLKYYRPFIKIFYLIEYKAFGTNPIGYNAASIFLNAFVVILCFILVSEVTGNHVTAFVSSLLYAVNPSRVEAVSWVYSISNMLMAVFCLTSLILYCRKKYAISLISFAAALLSRESSVLLPIILVLYEFFMRSQKSLKAYNKITYFFILTGIYLLVRQYVVGTPPLTDLNFFTLFNTIAVIIKRYVKIFFLPDAPVTAYQIKLFQTLDTEVVVSYLALVLLLFSGILIYRKKKEYFFWYLWFFAWLAFIFNVGKFAEYLMAEKELYLASLGFCVIAASFLSSIRIKKALITILITCIAIAYFSITFSRTIYWKDSVTYLEKLLQFTPDFYLPHYALATHYVSRNEYEKGFIEFEKTVKLNPGHSMSYNNIGNIHYLKGDPDKAVSAWEKAIKTEPKNPQPYFNIGLVMEQRGDIQQALEYYRHYLSLASHPPPDILGHINEIEKKLYSN